MLHVELHRRDLRRTRADLVVFGLFKTAKWPAELKHLDKSLDGLLSRRAKAEGFEAEAGSSVNLASPVASGPARVLLLGLGEEKKAERDGLKVFAGAAVSRARDLKAASLILVPPAIKDGCSAGALYSLACGAGLGDYRFDKYLSKKKRHKELTVGLHWPEQPAMPAGASAALERARRVAEAVSHARDLVNEPANVLTPETLARHARDIARRHRLAVSVFDARRIAREGMLLYLAVGQGSTRNPPRFIHLTYKPKGRRKPGPETRRVFLIGKGMTFDSGGLSIKTADGMMDMKIDMSGAAAVLSAMEVIAALKPRFEVHAVVAAAENMPDGHAYRPGDIFRSKSGKTVEVLNTDAEGRLTLADAITWSRAHKATEIVELSTLTGACMVALGLHTAGLFSADDKLAENLAAAARAEGEDLWRLPLTSLLRKQIKSDFADLKNIGNRYGGAITAALFLQEFAEGIPYAHLDIAGPATSDEDRGHIKKGGRGFGVATLVSYLCPLG